MTQLLHVICLGADAVVLSDPPRMIPPGAGGILLGVELRDNHAFRQLVKDKKLAFSVVSDVPPAAPMATPTSTPSIADEVEMKMVPKEPSLEAQPSEPSPSKRDRLGARKGKLPEPEGDTVPNP